MQKMPKRYYAFFTLPTLIAFIIAFFIPFIMGLYLSFTTFTTVTNSRWAGVSNYIRAFTEDSYFLDATVFTVKFAIVSVILINLFAFGLSLLLTRKMRGENGFRTIFFMPNLIGGIVLGYIWLLIINRNINQFRCGYHLQCKLRFLGFGGSDELADGGLYDGDLYRWDSCHSQ